MAAGFRGHTQPVQLSLHCRLVQTFLPSTALRGENDEYRQDENPGPCRSPAHHYRSAHSSLQSECIMLASWPAASTCTVEIKRKATLHLFEIQSAGGVFLRIFSSFLLFSFGLSLNSPVVCDKHTMEVNAPLAHTHIQSVELLPPLHRGSSSWTGIPESPKWSKWSCTARKHPPPQPSAPATLI